MRHCPITGARGGPTCPWRGGVCSRCVQIEGQTEIEDPEPANLLPAVPVTTAAAVNTAHGNAAAAVASGGGLPGRASAGAVELAA